MAKEFQPIELGDRVKDPITGMTGIVTCITTWLHGCIRMGVQPEEVKEDKKPAEAIYFDQSQLVVVKKAVHQPCVLQVAPKPAAETRRGNGGPSREGSGFAR